MLDLDDTFPQRIIMRCRKNLECTQHLVWMGRNFIIFQLVRSIRDLFQFNDLGILYTSNNQGNFHLKVGLLAREKLMSRQIKPTKMDHILNFLSWFVPCTRFTINAWHIKVEHLIQSSSFESLGKNSFKPTQYINYKGIKEKLSKIMKI